MDITNAEETKRPHRVTRTIRKKLEERMKKNHTVKSEDNVAKEIKEPVVEKIRRRLEKSPFGSGDLVSSYVLSGFTDKELLELKPGYYDYSNWDDDDGESCEETSFHSLDSDIGMGICWHSEIRIPYAVDEDTIEFWLGCGVHNALYVFNRFTGELADVRPDSIESERFYGKNRGTIKTRKEWLMSF